MIPHTDKPSDHNLYGVIYRATNSVNGKIYIGATIQSLKERIRGHISISRGSKRVCYFQRAIKKYGAEAFNFEIIDVCYTLEELDSKEIYYIDQYQSFLKERGYNLTFGGGGCRSTPEISLKKSKALKGRPLAEETKKKLSEAHKQLHEKRRAAGISIVRSPEAIQKTRLANTGKKRSKEFCVAVAERMAGNIVTPTKSVQQLDFTGTVVNEYVSEREASRQTGIDYSGISKACRSEVNICGGFCWQFKNGEDCVQEKIKKRVILPRDDRKKVLQSNMDGEIVREFSSLCDAAHFIGISVAAISRACRGKQKTCKGFIWSFKSDKDTASSIEKKTKRVLQFRPDGTFLEEFSSSLEASVKSGVRRNSIVRSCTGWNKTAGGFIWKYKEEATKND